ncbi:MAG: ATP-binding protein [Thermoguttaceae bacterium]
MIESASQETAVSTNTANASASVAMSSAASLLPAFPMADIEHILTQAQLGLWEIAEGGDGFVFIINDVGCKMHGLPPDRGHWKLEEFLAQCCHPDDISRTRLTFERLVKYPTLRQTLDIRIMHAPTSQWRWSRFFARGHTAKPEEASKNVRVIGAVQDIHDVFAYQSLLVEHRESQRHIASMLNMIPIAASVWTEEMTVIDINQTWLKAFALDDKGPMLAAPFSFVAAASCEGDSSKDELLRRILQAFREGDDGENDAAELTFVSASGEPIPATVRFVRITMDSRPVVVCFLYDLRKVKAAMAAVEEARHLAEESARAKGDFLANMSHEIRTPMNAILGMTYLLLQMDNNPKQKDFLDKIIHSAQLLLRILNDILDFSKIEAGKLEIEQISFSIRKCLEQIETLLRETAQKKGVALTLRVADDVPDELIGDPVRLGQIVMNLMTNAIKFTPKGGVTVTITAALPDEVPVEQRGVVAGNVFALHATVRDSGIGMTPEQSARLFQPFVQADSSTTRKFGGTGLGLAISKNLVEQMHGVIWCESAVGFGSSFHFVVQLPISDVVKDADDPSSADEFRSHAATGSAITRLNGSKILLAEDNAINQIVAVEMLKTHGCIVDVAANGREAIDALERGTAYEIILMDIQMPEMDGLQATAIIRNKKEYDHVPIIAMTAHAMSGDRERLLEAGMDDYITKPIVPEKLYSTLVRWLKRSDESHD